MSIVHWIGFTPPIAHPERFAIWSQDVQKVLDYLPRYIAAGRKQRVFALSWDTLFEEHGFRFPVTVSAEKFYNYHKHHNLEPLILPNQRQAYEHFIQQLPVHVQEDTQKEQADAYVQAIESLYGSGQHASLRLNLPGKGEYYFMAIEEGGTEPIPIRGPEGTGEPIVTETEVAFNVDVITYAHGDAFCLNLEEMLREDLFFWNLVGDPHDIAVKVALMRLVSYFPEIEVGSDREPSEWWEAALLSQKLFGVSDLPPGSWGDSGKLGEQAKRQLIALAASLPDF